MSVPPIEFLKDRIYLAAYDSPPKDTASLVHFSIDEDLLYNAFYHDFGPLHIGHLYRFAVILHEVLGSEANAGKAVCLYSRANPRDRANAACALCCYMVLLQAWPPHLAVAPISQADPPFMPFRDAGYAPADFVLTIQDVVYAIWRAKEYGLIDLRTFNLEEYERYERVDQGDFNEIPPYFIAFASPSQTPAEQRAGTINYPCQQVLDYFVSHGVQLVVRLNSFLYDKAIFEDRGIKHVDLVFDDGTCPTMDFVKAFIGAVEGVIQTPGAKVAVHCKAGLGRTGCLIGAHLIYTYGFTAQEAIAYMRFMRPGMVVGPQQHWLYLHQNEFRDWRRTMTVSSSASEKLAGFCPLVPKTSLRNRSRISSGVYSPGGSPPKTPERSILREVAHNSALPVPTPGQPRKGSPMAKSVMLASARKPVSRKQRPSRQETEEDEDLDEEEDGDRRESVYHDAASQPPDSAVNVEEDIYEEEEEEGVDGNETIRGTITTTTTTTGGTPGSSYPSHEELYEVGNDTVVDGTPAAAALAAAQSSPQRVRARPNAVTASSSSIKRSSTTNTPISCSATLKSPASRSIPRSNSNSVKTPFQSNSKPRGPSRPNTIRTTASGSPENTKSLDRHDNKSRHPKDFNGGPASSLDDNDDMYPYNDEGYPDDEYQVYNDEDEYEVYDDEGATGIAGGTQNVRVVGFRGQGTNSDEEDMDDEYNIGEEVDYESVPPSSVIRRANMRTNSDDDDDNYDEDPDLENQYYDETAAGNKGSATYKRISSQQRSSSPTRRSMSASSSPSRRSSSQFVNTSSSPSRRVSAAQMHNNGNHYSQHHHNHHSSVSTSSLSGKKGSVGSSNNNSPMSQTAIVSTSSSSGGNGIGVGGSGIGGRSTSQRQQQIIRVKKLRSSSGPVPVPGGVQVTTTTMTETTEFVATTPNSDPNLRHISRTPSGVRKTSGGGRIRRQ